MADEPTDDQLRDDAAAFMTLFINLVKEHQQAVTDALVSQAALLEAIFDAFPDVAAAYQKRLEFPDASSPLHEKNRQLLAQLDRLTASMKPKS